MAAELGQELFIFGWRSGRISAQTSNRTRGRHKEDPMGGVDCCIDAVGFQAIDRSDPSKENPTSVVNDIAKLVNPVGRVAIAGVYSTADLYPREGGYPNGRLTAP